MAVLGKHHDLKPVQLFKRLCFLHVIFQRDDLSQCSTFRGVRQVDKRCLQAKPLKFQEPENKLKLIFCMFILPLLEYQCPLWRFALTKEESEEIEWFQKRSLQINYESFPLPCSSYLETCKLDPFDIYRKNLCMKFGSTPSSIPFTRTSSRTPLSL